MPMSCNAMHNRAVALRSPAVISMSISRPGRVLATSVASRMSSSVSLPIALTTTTTSSPWRRVRATWSATWRMRSGSATDVPPNFWTSERPSPSDVTGRSRPGPATSGSPLSAPPLVQGLEQLGLGRVPDRAQRPDVVTAHREHPPVEVAPLEDDGAQVAHERRRVRRPGRALRGRGRAGSCR